jgi:hypothetical protein
VTGGSVFDFEPIMQRGNDPLDVGIGCDNKMKAASQSLLDRTAMITYPTTKKPWCSPVCSRIETKRASLPKESEGI